MRRKEAAAEKEPLEAAEGREGKGKGRRESEEGERVAEEGGRREGGCFGQKGREGERERGKGRGSWRVSPGRVDDGWSGQRGPGPSSVRRAMRWCRLKDAWALNGYYLAVQRPTPP